MIDLHPLQTLTFWSHCYSVAKATCLRPSEVQTEPLRKSQRVPPTAQPPLRWLCARLIEFTCPDLTGGGREMLEIDFYRVLACICGCWLTAVKIKVLYLHQWFCEETLTSMESLYCTEGPFIVLKSVHIKKKNILLRTVHWSYGGKHRQKSQNQS